MPDQPQSDPYIAAIDLGSNSFHLVIAQEGEQGGIKIIDQMREMVRLGAGLDAQGNLTEPAQQAALLCLRRFRQRLHSIPVERIRAVGTNTLRAAKNSDDFLRLAQAALGLPISVISGHEEARLIYLGAAFDLSGSGKKRLVVDIGGGSTELVIGEGYKPLHMDSLFIGCVSMTRRYFPDGFISKTQIHRATNVVLRELEPVVKDYLTLGWNEVVGTSGTIKAVDNVARCLGLKQDWISLQGMDEITKWMIDAKFIKNLQHVSEQRRPVFPGGFVILSTILKELHIARMDISAGALREGVAYDLIGRLHDEDSRNQGVESLVNQFRLDLSQSARVVKSALLFLQRVEDKWNLADNIDKKLLTWAAQLHEIGISIAYSHHHLHGAYIIENSNMDGFSRQVQRVLALLVRNHRQKIDLEQIRWLPEQWPVKVIRLSILLRLAVTFYRGRVDVDLSHIDLLATDKGFSVVLSKDWADQHPLTMFDLETEQGYLNAAGYEMIVDIV